MGRRVVPVVMLAWMTTAACGRPPTPPGKTPAEARSGRENQPPAAGPAEPGVRVQIIQAGRAPRRALRYRFRPDHLGVMSTTFDMDIAYRTGGGTLVHTPSPPMAMDMELTRLEVTGGTARAVFRVSRFDVTSSPSDATDEQTKEAVRQRLALMVGMTGWMEMDDRGRLRGMAYDIPASLPVATRSILEGMSQSGKDMAVPLPEEPVGVGAEWYVVQESPFMGIDLAHNTRVAVVAIDGDRVTLRYSIDIGAGNQPFRLPGLPAGTTAELMSCEGSGGAEIELDL
ncbi:MAG TPA: hypothetical protein VIG06_18850, partial [Kofleriaceae bacterium]